MARRRPQKLTAPRPPSPEERADSSAEELSRHVTEAHPKVKRLRQSIERRLRSAMRGAMRHSSRSRRRRHPRPSARDEEREG